MRNRPKQLPSKTPKQGQKAPKQGDLSKVKYVYRKDAFNKVKIA